MVPAPNSTGDEFPDFEHMTLEEQMAWLESLARRQGAKEEEFVTAADLNVPVPENPVIDEPGYVPYSISESAAEQEPAKKPGPPAPKKAKEKPAPVVPEPVIPEAEPVFGAEDPMRWLESLAAQPVGEIGISEVPEETARVELFDAGKGTDFEFDLGLEPGFELDLGLEEELEAEPAQMPEPEIDLLQGAAQESGFAGPEGEAVPAGGDDFLAGIDPMLWLESLAARQGAATDQLTTSANLEIPEVPEGTVIDEPGYVPYDISSDSGKAAAPPPAQQESEPEAPVELAPEPALSGEEADMLGGADPMTWLESLAKRQGAKMEELTTAADLEIPQLPADTVIDEPGYEPFDVFASETGFAHAEAAFRPSAEPAPEPESIPAEIEPMGEPLSWLEALTAEPEADVAALLALEKTTPELEVEPSPPAPRAKPADPLANMTDDEIAYAQAHGQLTGEQELAWLQRQAARLAETRREMEIGAAGSGEVEPAQPAELPDWLSQMRDEAEEGGELAPAAEELIPSGEPVELPGWLTEASAAPPIEAELPDLSFEAGADSLWAEMPDQAERPAPSMIVESELDAFLEGKLVPEEPDQLAEALDAEYERRITGDDSEPAWYTEAVARGAVEVAVAPEAEVEKPAETAFEPTLTEAVAVDMPDWLREREEKPAPAAGGALPSWLTEELEPAVRSEVIPDWLTEAPETPEQAEWLKMPEAAAAPAKPIPPVEEKPVLPAVEPEAVVSPKKQVSIPEGALFAEYRQRLEENPNDYANRLALARALRANREWAPSLDQYEVLIDTMQLLQDVLGDLAGLSQEQPRDPRVHRLLGDTYMRRGMLQEALDAYRKALEQL